MAMKLVNFRADEEWLERFKAVAKKEDMTASQLLRRLIRVEVRWKETCLNETVKDGESNGEQ